MRKRYVVTTKNGREGFTEPGIEALKRLGMVTFTGSNRTQSGTVYNYVGRVR